LAAAVVGFYTDDFSVQEDSQGFSYLCPVRSNHLATKPGIFFKHKWESECTSLVNLAHSNMEGGKTDTVLKLFTCADSDHSCPKMITIRICEPF